MSISHSISYNEDSNIYTFCVDNKMQIYFNDKTKIYTTKGLITILNDNMYEKFPVSFLEQFQPYLLKFLIVNNYFKIFNEYIYKIKHIPKDVYIKSNWNILKKYINSKNIGDLINRTKYIEEINEFLTVTSFDMYCNCLCKISILKKLKEGNYEIIKQIPKELTTTRLTMNLSKECIRGNLENAKYLVEQGSDISVNNYTPLRYALIYGNLEIVNYFRKVLGDKIPCHECLVRPTCLEICF